MSNIKRIVITSGEPAGIGPDIIVKLDQQKLAEQIIVIGDQQLLEQRAKLLNKPIEFVAIDINQFSAIQSEANTFGKNQSVKLFNPDAIPLIHIPANNIDCIGTPDTANVPYVLSILDKAVELCQKNIVDAMVTCPIHKGIINQAGIPFTGHTEYLAKRTNTNHVVMMLANANFRVALATTHLPLKDVSAAITKESLTSSINILHDDLKHRFNINHPTIFISGLNPHAGEQGHLGTEEINIITPVIDELKQQGFKLQGPFPADTMFTQKNIKQADAFLVMYHDQGLPVIKYADFDNSVNITLGLPIIRTSVDHGTALDIAGTGSASPQSLIAAIKLASSLS